MQCSWPVVRGGAAPGELGSWAGLDHRGSRRPHTPERSLVTKKWNLTLADLKAQIEGTRMVAQKDGNQSRKWWAVGLLWLFPILFSLLKIWFPKRVWFCLGPVSDSWLKDSRTPWLRIQATTFDLSAVSRKVGVGAGSKMSKGKWQLYLCSDLSEWMLFKSVPLITGICSFFTKANILEIAGSQLI